MNKLYHYTTLLPLGLAFSTVATAASLDVDINSDAVRADYNLSRHNADLKLTFGGIVTDDNGNVAFLTVHTQGTLMGNQNIKGGFGGRAYHASPDGGDSFQSLALGGFIDVTVPEMPELSVGAELHYAPSITTTDDIDNLNELSFRVSYQLFENASVYLGLRYLEVEVGNFDYEFVDGGHAGFSLNF